MKIYTKRGDQGETSLYGGARVPKDDLRIRTYGGLDEMNSIIGLSLAEGQLSSGIQTSLTRIQSELFQLGAELATQRKKVSGTKLIDSSQVSALELEIDEMEKDLPALKTFILPGGSKAAATIHLARAVCRRAERELITLNRAEPLRPTVLQYINRLSDYLFVVARYINFLDKRADTPWVSSL